MWAIVELMGHNTLAGEVTPSADFSGLIQIDVPTTEKIPAFSKIVNPSAVYAINPVTEETARIKAENLAATPIQLYDVRAHIMQAIAANDHKGLEAGYDEDEDDDGVSFDRSIFN